MKQPISRLEYYFITQRNLHPNMLIDLGWKTQLLSKTNGENDSFTVGEVYLFF